MKIVIYIGKKLMKLIYFFQKKRKTENKILMISRQSNNVSSDFIMLKSEIEDKNDGTQAVILCKQIGHGFFGKFKYVLYMLNTMMKNIATAKVVLLDGYCIPISVLNHKEDLIVIQMWHAMGALKKMGYCILDQEEGSSSYIAKALNMHKGYDYIFTSSKNCIPMLTLAYGAKANKFIVKPLPRVDKIKKACMGSKILKAYPQLDEKLNILYAPTFRKDGSLKMHIERFAETIDYENYNLIISNHPLYKEKIENENPIIVKEFTSIELLDIADYVVTDYSAFVFEAAVANKPIFLYTPDIEEYDVARGFYIDLTKEDFAFASKNSKEVYKAIENKDFSLEKIKKFCNKYVEPSDNCTNDIVDFIYEKMK